MKMKTPIQSAGEAMSFPPKALLSELLDVSNMIDNSRDLVEAVFMAASGVGDRHHTNAIQSVCDVIEQQLIAVGHKLEEIREAL
jgi:mannitol/fructose-specific phosphotransferase system IIA component (Ntr-type)